ncbi:MAG: sulfurtransferase TusA family protein [Candidatus Marinimicrobia bacterium]|nr:sulfurtransferase TusA family protein [Candidatus Neomarinimicrobiota bacterium]
MATEKLDCLGMKCPQPILKVVTKIKQMNPGDMLEVEADCPSFPSDIKAWAEKTGRILMLCSTDADGKHSAQIQA